MSIVIPALNEELIISEFVAWCHEGLRRRGPGEILIVDSSTDRTAELALAGGARVLRTPKRGLGRAYIDAVPFIRGRYVLMGDADCTYDFRQLAPFVEKLREGYDFAMGSRWLGSIEAGAMPALHRYVGTPVTTWVLNRIYGSQFTDIHCGMRVHHQGRPAPHGTHLAVVGVRLGDGAQVGPDGPGHRRGAGHLLPGPERADDTPQATGGPRPSGPPGSTCGHVHYRAEYFVLKPGLALLALGLLLTLPLTFGPISIGPVTFSLYWMLLGLTLAVLGLQSFFFGCLAQVLSDYSGAARPRWTRVFRYTRAVGQLRPCSSPGWGWAVGARLLPGAGFSLPGPRPRRPTWPSPACCS